jgi:AraC-like DNA-binding protein
MNYSDVAHLSNQFKKMSGMTPTNFKKALEFKRNQIDSL